MRMVIDVKYYAAFTWVATVTTLEGETIED